MPTIVLTDAQTGETLEREMTPEEEAELPLPPTPEELEAEVQALADEVTDTNKVQDERMFALALATVDLVMADTGGMTVQQVRAAYRDRVVHYLRQRRGL